MSRKRHIYVRSVADNLISYFTYHIRSDPISMARAVSGPALDLALSRGLPHVEGSLTERLGLTTWRGSPNLGGFIEGVLGWTTGLEKLKLASANRHS